MKRPPEQINVILSFPATVREDKMMQILEWVDFNNRRPEAEATVLLATESSIAVGRVDAEGRIEAEFRLRSEAGAERCGHIYTHWAALPRSPISSDVAGEKAPAERKKGQLGLWE